MADSVRVVLGFDYGIKRIGVAVGNLITHTATPLPILSALNGAPKWDQVSKLIADWSPDAFVIGLPLYADGADSQSSKGAKRFGNRLNGRYNLPVFWMNERLSSYQAELTQRENNKIYGNVGLDSLAAKLIVESWLTDGS